MWSHVWPNQREREMSQKKQLTRRRIFFSTIETTLSGYGRSGSLLCRAELSHISPYIHTYLPIVPIHTRYTWVCVFWKVKSSPMIGFTINQWYEPYYQSDSHASQQLFLSSKHQLQTTGSLLALFISFDKVQRFLHFIPSFFTSLSK